MKTLFSILGLIASIIALVLAVLPMENIAIIPAIAAFIFGIIALLMSKKESKKLITFVFFVTIVALALITYKSIFSKEIEVKADEDFIEQTQKSEEKALEELENLPELDNFEVDTDSVQ